PPELERELPGPQASTSVTFAPACRRCSAVQPPNAPAPTTVMRGLEEHAIRVMPASLRERAGDDRAQTKADADLRDRDLALTRPEVPPPDAGGGAAAGG